jgi:NAD(P)-dependent dehydrogenase (short-subunit alcohol dehydrogenase family)
VVLDKAALADKVAIVIGGRTGIGAGISQSHKRTAAGLREGGASAIIQACDVCDNSQVQTLFDVAVRELERVDILINNGVSPNPIHCSSRLPSKNRSEGHNPWLTDSAGVSWAQRTLPWPR